jgi:hypothetical protein
MFESIEASLKETPKLYFNIGARNSFITNQYATVRDIKAGLNYNKQFTLAVGYSWLNSDFKATLKNGVDARLKMRYITPYMEYSFLEKNNIEVTIPVHLGLGISFYQDENKKQYNKSFILTYEPAMSITYRFFSYFGVGVGIGYRLVLIGNNSINENFTSPIYLLKAKLFLGDIYQDILKPK